MSVNVGPVFGCKRAEDLHEVKAIEEVASWTNESALGLAKQLGYEILPAVAPPTLVDMHATINAAINEAKSKTEMDKLIAWAKTRDKPTCVHITKNEFTDLLSREEFMPLRVALEGVRANYDIVGSVGQTAFYIGL